MKINKELNQQVLNTSVDEKGRPTINIDRRKSIYNSTSEALKAIPITNRNVGLTVPIYNGIKVVEYWWEKGIKDSDLVKKINGDDIPRIDNKLIDLQNQINEINNIEFKIFDSLPELGTSSIIYVIPNTTSEEDDDFIEYIWIKSQQRYKRFGGLNIDGGVTINNFYTFDSNVFAIDEESNIKKVSLNNKKINIDHNGINIYKFNVGEIDNEIQVNIYRTALNTNDASYGGGHAHLYGYYNVIGHDSKIYTTSLDYSAISVSCKEGNMHYISVLTPTSLYITDNDTKEFTISKDGIEYEVNNTPIFKVNNNNFNSISEKVLIQATGNNGFNINWDECGIQAFLHNNTKKVRLYASDTVVTLTNNNIALNVGETSNINLNNENINIKSVESINLDAPITKVKKVLFDRFPNYGYNICLEPYHIVDADYHEFDGLKSESNIYLFNKKYYVLSSGNELSSYELNAIKYRTSSNSTGFGDNIISWSTENNNPVLNLGPNNNISIKYDRMNISLLHGTIGLYTLTGDIQLSTPNNKIGIYLNNIKFKLGNVEITMTSDGISDGINTKTWAQLLS